MKLQRQALELLWHRILPNYVTGLFGAVRLFTAGWMTGRERALLYDINRFYGTFRNYPTPQLPQRNAEELLDCEQPIVLLEASGVNGNVSVLELLILVHMVRAAEPQVLFEIGTFDGRTTLNLTANAPPDARSYTLDLPASGVNSTSLPVTSGDRGLIQKPTIGARFKSSPFRHRIHQLLGDSASFDFSPWKGTVDFVFIDGAHSYEYVRNDTGKALELLRGGKGIIVWHDYALQPGVTAYLDEFHAAGGPGAGLAHIEGTSLAWARL